MKIRRLKTASDVIDFCGGPVATAALVRRSARGRKLKIEKQHVSNWRRCGRLPPETFLIFKSVLERRGALASPSLWRIVEPRRIAQGTAHQSRVESGACG